MRSTSDGVGAREAGVAQGSTLVAQQVLPTMGPLLLVPVIPLILRDYGDMPGAAYWVPSLITVPALCIAFLSIFAGLLGDRVGRRRPLIAALMVYGAAGTAPLFLTSFAAVFASRVVLGTCEAVIATLSMTMLADYFTGARRDRWLALVTTVGAGSGVLFFALSGALGAKFGWRAPTAVYGFALLIVPAMLALTWEPTRHLEEASAAGERFPWAHVLGVGAMALLGGTFFFVVAIQQAFGLVALDVTDPARIGLLTAIAGLGNPIGSLLFRRFTGVPSVRLLAIEMLLIGGALVAMSRSASDIHFAIAAFVGLLGAGLLMPTLVTWMIRGLPFAFRSRGTGVFQSMFCFGQFISGLILPFLARNVVDGMLAAFGLLGIVGLIVAAIAFVRAASGARRVPATG